LSDARQRAKDSRLRLRNKAIAVSELLNPETTKPNDIFLKEMSPVTGPEIAHEL
jgi:hypothetical protein